jgi:hypothetical protein
VGTSPTTGASFVFNDVQVSILPDIENSFFEGTDEFTSMFITKRGALNSVLRFKYHLTINSNGTGHELLRGLHHQVQVRRSGRGRGRLLDASSHWR